jgi:PPM family protein phosphatase
MSESLLSRFRSAVRGRAMATPTIAGAAVSRGPDAQRMILMRSEHLCAITDVGRGKSHNEDLVHLSGDCRLMAVADGMGGHLSGQTASTLAIMAVADCLEPLLAASAVQDAGALKREMRRAMDEAQCRVLAEGMGHDIGEAMGCTLIVACTYGDSLYTCHVGDVRAYLWRCGELRALTRDHSVVAELVAAGELTPDQARSHPAKNEVLQAVGMPDGFEPSINTASLDPGDRVLLCSDGLWESLSDQEISAIVGSEGSMRQIAIQLVDRANDNGGRDNTSVVMYEHRLASGLAIAEQSNDRDDA